MIACLSVPYFAAAVEQREDKQLTEQAAAGLVIGGQPWEPQPVYAFSTEPAKKGVRPGMSLRLAHVLSPQSRFIPAHPPRYLSASGEITDLLTDFTHLVEPEALWLPPVEKRVPRQAVGRLLPARYTLDLEKLPASEALALTREIGRSVRSHTHLAPAVGLAEGKFAAQVAAAITRPNHIRSLAGRQEEQFLAERSVRFLPLEVDTVRRLSLLGIRTLGQLADLPAHSLQIQFGADFMAAYRLIDQDGVRSGAWPAEDASVRPLPLGRQEQVSHDFEAPVANLLILENVLGRLAATLAQRLQAAGLEARRLQLSWQLDVPRHRLPETPLQVGLTNRTPVADLQRLSQLLCEMMRRTSLSHADGLQDGITQLTVTAGDLLPAQSRQLSLFEPAADPVDRLLQNVAAKHGTGLFFRPALTDSCHLLPERRFQLRAWESA